MLAFRYYQRAIYNYYGNYGPTFGGGYDLYIPDDCHTTNGYSELGHTYRPPNGYGHVTWQARNVLAGSYRFRCDEYEVFYQAWLETKSNSGLSHISREWRVGPVIEVRSDSFNVISFKRNL